MLTPMSQGCALFIFGVLLIFFDKSQCHVTLVIENGFGP